MIDRFVAKFRFAALSISIVMNAIIPPVIDNPDFNLDQIKVVSPSAANISSSSFFSMFSFVSSFHFDCSV
jgi:hypothetical protein